MSEKERTRIGIYCAEQAYAIWSQAMALYDVFQAPTDQPLDKLLSDAAAQGTTLFVIVDGTCKNDEDLLSGIQAYREVERKSIPYMRIAFVANEKRETPSYLFRMLVNMDVLDLIVPPADKNPEYSPYFEVAQVISRPKVYTDVVAYLAGSIVNPRLIGLPASEQLKEKSRSQVRIGVAQIEQKKGGSTHVTLLLARVLILLGYKVAVFLDQRTWKNLRRCYPRARCSVANGLIALSGIDFYRNEGFARVNGYDYVIADFGCARWIDIQSNAELRAMEENFGTSQLAVLTSVVSPLGDHTPLERVLKIWQKKGQLRLLGGVKFAFFGVPNDRILKNWQAAAQQLNAKAELYNLPYLPDPLHYEPSSEEGYCPELVEILAPVLRPKDC